MSTWQLYALDDRIRDFIDRHIDEETGEVSDEMEKGLAALEVEREELIEGVALMIREKLAEADAVRAEGQRLTSRASKIESNADAMKERLGRFVGEGNKIKTARISIYWSKSSGVWIEREKDLPLWALKTSVSPDKVKLREVLQTGSEEERSEIDGNVSLRSRAFLAIR